jgi:hypothetical protein
VGDREEEEEGERGKEKERRRKEEKDAVYKYFSACASACSPACLVSRRSLYLRGIFYSLFCYLLHGGGNSLRHGAVLHRITCLGMARRRGEERGDWAGAGGRKVIGICGPLLRRIDLAKPASTRPSLVACLSTWRMYGVAIAAALGVFSY